MADPPLVFAGVAFCAAALRRRASEPAVLGTLGFRSRLALCLTFSGLGLEACAWLGSWLAADPSPRLMHPQLGPDLLLGAGFYGGMALAFSVVAVRFAVSPAAASAVYGLWGILFEQRGALPPAAAKSFSAAPLATSWVVARVGLVYGAVALLAFALAGRRLAAPRPRGAWLAWPLGLAALTVGAFGGTAAVALAFHAAGGLPPPGPIRTRPLW